MCGKSTEPSASRRRPSNERGFTLIEVLVALSILAIALGFAFRVFSAAQLSLSGGEHEQMALTLAQSLLDRTGRDIALRDGDISGQTGDGFRWQVSMTPAALPRGIVVRVNVAWTELRRARQLQLSTLRLAEPGAR